MSAPIKLSAVVQAMENPEDWECFLDPDTGEVFTVTDDDRGYFEEEDAVTDDLPDWQRESIAQARKAMESEKLLPLPGKLDVHEWDLMRQFSTMQDEPTRRELLHAIHGTGAFRLFRATNDRLGLRDDWFKFKDEALKEVARTWLRSHGLEFVEE
jgi:hypothetical protein